MLPSSSSVVKYGGEKRRKKKNCSLAVNATQATEFNFHGWRLFGFSAGRESYREKEKDRLAER